MSAMNKFLILLVLVCTVLFCSVVAGKKGRGCKGKALKKKVNAYNNCLNQGFPSSLGCKSEGSGKIKGKRLKKCKKLEKSLKKCAYSCKGAAKECSDTVLQKDYRGTKATTESGLTCQKWTTQSPHGHTRTIENYPGSGVGDHNYCRNPDDEPEGAWCYTTDPGVRWKYCGIPRCEGEETHTGEACEGGKDQLSIDCGDGLIKVKHAAYGVYSNDNSCDRTYDGECIAGTSLAVMSEKCDGKNSCSVPASNTLFGDPCGDIYKYLVATWECSAGSCDCTNVNSDTFTATEVVYGSNAEITALKPAAVGTKTITDGGSETQSVVMSVSEKVSDTVSFTHTAGASVTVGTKFKAGIPGIVNGEVSTAATASYEFSYGTDKSITNTVTAEFTCQGPAGKRTVCKAMLFKDQISIPYTMTWQKKLNSNCVCKEQGLFKEVAANKLEMEVSETPLEEEVGLVE